MQTRLPSVKMLRAIARDLTPKEAREIRTAIKGNRQQLDDLRRKYYPNRFVRIGETEYSQFERGEIISRILGTHGVDTVYLKATNFDTFSQPYAFICNAGDLYSSTLVYYRDAWRVMSECTLREKGYV